MIACHDVWIPDSGATGSWTKGPRHSQDRQTYPIGFVNAAVSEDLSVTWSANLSNGYFSTKCLKPRTQEAKSRSLRRAPATPVHTASPRQSGHLSNAISAATIKQASVRCRAYQQAPGTCGIVSLLFPLTVLFSCRLIIF
jgi:hypothetical protein